MGQIYYALGLSVGCITSEQAFFYDPNFVVPEKLAEEDRERDLLGSFKVEQDFLRPVSRREAYAADITYGTNNEFGFDYLRDNLAMQSEDKVQRGFAFALIDEIDNILIDEARTPLIISAPAQEAADLYHKVDLLVKQLRENDDFSLDEKQRSVHLTEQGQTKLIGLLGEDPWQTNNVALVGHIDNAVMANSRLFQKNKEYLVKNNEIFIVDEFTGRVLHGRRYSEGLHQALEAKEGLSIKQESQTLATISFQNYFRLYKKLAGMTGTAITEAEEFKKIYNLEVVKVPTNKAMVRKDQPDFIYRTEEAKNKAIIEEIIRCYKKGQPILVGTRSVERNEFFSGQLERRGVPHKVLNAKQHEKEGETIAQAGKFQAVTIATNMAGRGVDIILGGNPCEEKEQAKVKELGGLYVLGTERHESRRIDNQLRGRSGRQGDPGASRFFISMEDDLMRIFGGEKLSNMMQMMKMPEDVPLESRLVSRAVEQAQTKVEGYNFDVRKHLLEYDDVLNKQRQRIYAWRDKILAMSDDEVRQEVRNKVQEEIVELINNYPTEEWTERIQRIFPLNVGQEIQQKTAEEAISYFESESQAAFEKLEKDLAVKAEENKMVPNDFFTRLMKNIILQSLDHYWIDYLSMLENLRKGIGLRAYGQHDPLMEYKRESYQKFKEFEIVVRKQIVYSIFRLNPNNQETSQQKSRRMIVTNANSAPLPTQPNIGRNDPCPCGSGKKYKKCHGA